MTSNRKSQQERFQVLMEQARISEDLVEQYFQEAYIEKLQLLQENKKWIFHLVLQAVLPVSVYQLLHTRIKETFEHLAQTEIVFRFEQQVEQQACFEEYWPLFLEQHRPQLNGLYNRLQDDPPVWQDNSVQFTISVDFEADLLQKKIEPLLSRFYGQFFTWNQKVVCQLHSSDEDYQQFIEARAKEDEARAFEAMKDREEKPKPIAGKQVIDQIMIGYKIKDEAVPIQQIQDEEKKICIQGQIFDLEIRELRSGRSLLIFKITDYSDSLTIKCFSRDQEDVAIFEAIKKGMWVKVRGSVQMDTFLRDLAMMANDIQQIKVELPQDTREQKRVELHLHSNMSAMDGISPVSRYVERAAAWGHSAIAITDHGVAQAFPEAYSAGKKHGLKILYGIEANLVDDGVPIVYNPEPRSLLEETYVVFDVETTGLSAVYDTIIELAAVKICGGEVMERFERFANPHQPLTPFISDLTGITDDMLVDAPEVEEVLEDFYHFIENHTLVAHNASFDMGFLHIGYKKLQKNVSNPVIDTLEMARFLFPSLRNHRLNTLCKKLDIELLSHHRAVYDAEATGYLLWKMIKQAVEQEIEDAVELGQQKGEGDFHRTRPTHATILAKNQTGLKNLYKLISLSHMKYFFRTPRIPKSLLLELREGLIVGSGCDQGEVFEAMMQKSPEEVEELASFYDYLEVHPPSNYEHLLKKEIVKDKKHLEEIISKIVELGKKLEKVVVATGNAHYVEQQEAIYRKILITTLGGASFIKPDQLPQVHFKSTDEMLADFQFLGEKQAQEIVVENTNQIADLIEHIQPIPDDLYAPRIEGADEEVRQMSYTKAKQIYGEPLPDIVEKRLEKELTSIIGHGFAVIYLISSKLVTKSLGDGYLVGSRGSVGSSFVATMTDITEVNPLAPHYVCPSCHYSHFYEDGSVSSGFDLPDKDCPECSHKLIKDGHDIPFETFLGFKGDKVPDIDLNFSGDYQPVAHKYTQELFGEDNVYRAGTIGTVADKTAFGFVKKYEEEAHLSIRSAEIQRLASGCTGVKRTTGQHPGGIIVVPDYKDIYDFTPIQYPADDTASEWRTTHFDFHSIHDNLLKLDILGHDDPTVIRMLQDLSGLDPKTIPTDDAEVMKIFSGTESLGVTEEQIMSKTGSLGIPEFGTRFVRQMLEDTKPTTFAELVQISGLSHGTDVWLNNAQEIIQKEIAPLAEVISTRDDIMVYLIHKGLDSSRAFKIMEGVRKGKGLVPEDIEYMKQHDVPPWYIESCLKIKYMFPKAHAVAYVLMAVRIAYFKVHYPIFFYATYFTVRADDFDVDLACKGSLAIRKRIEEILVKGNDALPKEKSLLTVLELCLEMVERGLSFQRVDLYRSHATQFIVEGDSLLPPFDAIPGVGSNAAQNIMKAREGGEFLSKEDLQQRSRITKTVLEYLDDQGCLSDLPDSNQLSLF